MDLVIERDFSVSPETVFSFVTERENISKWWGPENMTCPILEMDMAKLGPWTATMQNAEGGKYKVSGVVEAVDPPNSVEFTWGWHDDGDDRGHESRVRFDISSDGKGGSKFKLTHTDLADEESVGNHNMGWTSSIRKLEAKLN